VYVECVIGYVVFIQAYAVSLLLSLVDEDYPVYPLFLFSRPNNSEGDNYGLHGHSYSETLIHDYQSTLHHITGGGCNLLFHHQEKFRAHDFGCVSE
jgi:hypothetical protein